MRTVKRVKKRKPAWELHLYIADTTPRSLLAMANLQSLCEQYLQQGYNVRIIDIIKDPAAAIRDDILATPTLVRVQPTPQKTVIGSLADAQRVLRGLDLCRPGAHNDPRSPKPVVAMQEVGAA